MGARQRVGSVAAAALAASSAGAGGASAQLPPPLLDDPPRLARIAFSVDGGLHMINADGSDRRRLTTPTRDGFDDEPAWSPDGATIAFSRDTDTEGEEGRVLIWLTAPDGSGQRQLTPSPKRETGEFSPAWSPDGARIAFVRMRAGEDRLSVSIVTGAGDGSDQRVVYREVTDYESDDGAFFYSLAWSPGGDRILFTRDSSGLAGSTDSRPSLWAVPSAGGKPQLLASRAEDAAWSPDGARIAYAGVHNRRGGACDAYCEPAGEIFVMNADGSDRRRITTTKADDSAPSWSGDGQRIAFHSDRNAPQGDDEEPATELYSVRPDGTCLTWLTNGTAHSEMPAFEPGAGLSGEPGGCGPTEREPLVETDTARTDAFRGFPVWWLGRVSPNGLLLTDAEPSGDGVWFGYHDCGRFDPAECGEFVNVVNLDLCRGQRVLPRAGRRGHRLSLFRGALRHEFSNDEELGSTDLYSGRTKLELSTPSGSRVGAPVLEALQRLGANDPAAPFRAPALPVRYWRELAKRRGVPRPEVRRRRAVAKRLAQLGVERRLGCSG